VIIRMMAIPISGMAIFYPSIIQRIPINQPNF
jgi:hypothetical protein